MVGCGPEIKANELGALPEATHLPKGAVVLTSGGVDGSWGPDGNNYSEFMTRAGVTHSAEAIKAFDDAALLEAGWTALGDPPVLETSTERWAWQKGDYELQVYVMFDKFFERVEAEHPDWTQHANMIEVSIYGHDRAE